MNEKEIFDKYIKETGYKEVTSHSRPEHRRYSDESGKLHTPSDIKISVHYWGFFHGLRNQKSVNKRYSESSLK